MTDTNGWLPQDYKEPVTSNYMNFEEGSNLFRILGKFSDGTAIMGFEYWKTLTVDGKPKRSPIRVKQDVVINSDEIELNPKTGQPDFPKFFWAVPVFNYSVMKVQLLEIKQRTVRQAIVALTKNPKWGDPSTYDICVNRVEDSGKTSYTVTPDPKSEIEPEILKVYESMKININALFNKDSNTPGADPFAPVNQAESLAEEADKILKEAK